MVDTKRFSPYSPGRYPLLLKNRSPTFDDVSPEAIQQLTSLLCVKANHMTSEGPDDKWLKKQKRKVSHLHQSLLRPNNVLTRAALAAAQRGMRGFPDCAILCPSHYELDPRLIRNLMALVGRECTKHVDPCRDSRTRKKRIEISEAVQSWMSRMDSVTLTWFTTRKFKAYYGYPCKERVLPRIQSGCEACMLAMIAGHPDVLRDIRAGLVSRQQILREKKGESAKQPRLLNILETAIDHHGQADQYRIRSESNALAVQISEVRRRIKARQEEIKKSKAKKHGKKKHRLASTPTKKHEKPVVQEQAPNLPPEHGDFGRAYNPAVHAAGGFAHGPKCTEDYEREREARLRRAYSHSEETPSNSRDSHFEKTFADTARSQRVSKARAPPHSYEERADHEHQGSQHRIATWVDNQPSIYDDGSSDDTTSEASSLEEEQDPAVRIPTYQYGGFQAPSAVPPALNIQSHNNDDDDGQGSWVTDTVHTEWPGPRPSPLRTVMTPTLNSEASKKPRHTATQNLSSAAAGQDPSLTPNFSSETSKKPRHTATRNPSTAAVGQDPTTNPQYIPPRRDWKDRPDPPNGGQGPRPPPSSFYSTTPRQAPEPSVATADLPFASRGRLASRQTSDVARRPPPRPAWSEHSGAGTWI